MAQRVNTYLVDDLDGSEAAETVELGLDGFSYELDLSEEHATELRNALSDYIEAGRKVSGRAKSTKPRQAGSGGRVDREQAQAQREWARREGFEISDRGRVPGWVKEKYEAAHQGSAA